VGIGRQIAAADRSAADQQHDAGKQQCARGNSKPRVRTLVSDRKAPCGLAGGGTHQRPAGRPRERLGGGTWQRDPLHDLVDAGEARRVVQAADE